jgi:hypothetical protein
MTDAMLPERIKRLPVWQGVRVPWWVPWTSTESEAPTEAPAGRPRFDLPWRPERFARAVRERRCWVCGDYLGAVVVFVTQPHWVVQGFAGEPPCHRECAEWSVLHCPYFVSAVDAPVVVLWPCRQFARVRTEAGEQIKISGAIAPVGWYWRGKPASRIAVSAAFARVLPELRRMHAGDVAAKAELERSLRDIMLHHVPKF